MSEHQRTERERIADLRRFWFGDSRAETETVDLNEPVVARGSSADPTDAEGHVAGFRFQRCGGGRRVIRKQPASN